MAGLPPAIAAAAAAAAAGKPPASPRDLSPTPPVNFINIILAAQLVGAPASVDSDLVRSQKRSGFKSEICLVMFVVSSTSNKTKENI